MKEYFWKTHRDGRTPFAFHTDELGARHQHYPATFYVSAFVGFIVTNILYLKAAQSIPSLGFNHATHSGRQAMAAIGLIGLAAYFGFFVGAIHNAIYKNVKNHSQVSVRFDEQKNDEDEAELSDRSKLTAINESSNLIGKDKNEALIYKVGKYHPLHWVYPPTPLKTAVWIPVLGLAAFALACLIQPNIFNQFAGVSAVANSSTFFVDCNSTATHTEGCVFLFGCVMGYVSSMVFVSAGIGGLATLFHYGAARASESDCCSSELPYQTIG